MYRDKRMAQYLCAAAITCVMGNKSADHMRKQLFEDESKDLSDFWYDMAAAVHQAFRLTSRDASPVTSSAIVSASPRIIGTPSPESHNGKPD